MNEQQLLPRIEAVENNLNATAAGMLAINAILAALPETSRIDPGVVDFLLRGLTRQQPALSRLLPAAQVIANTLLTQAHEVDKQRP